jgi:oxygen-independent coproporphyrinogen-3 oxidase
LTIEPNTEFYSKPPSLPNDDRLADIQQAGMELLEANGFKQYEVSAYARNGQTSRHNINYWQFGDYLGIGAGAHGKITLPQQNMVIRTSKTRQPDNYLARQESVIAQHSAIEPDQMAVEFMMNGLRLKNGVPTELLAQRTGLDPSGIAPQVAELQSQKLMVSGEQSYCTTDLGYRFLNKVLESF